MSPWRRAAGSPAAAAGALSLAALLLPSVFHLVPTPAGPFRGVSDPPSLLRAVLAVALGLAALPLLARLPERVRSPWLVLGLSAAPCLSVLTGRFPLLLAFQGPSLVLLAALAAGVTLGRLACSRDLRLPPGWVLFGAAFAVYALLGTRLPGPAGPQGDEPHYLTLAQSLLSDGDLDLADEFAGREYAPFFGGTLEAHTSPASPRGRLYSVHTPGLPVLLLPAYALGGYPAARLLMSALAALAGVLVARLVAQVGGPGTALAAWAALSFTPPLAFYAVAIYPETPAALATAAFLLATRRDPAPGRLLLLALLAAGLPWLHPKFLPLAVLGLGLLLARRGSRLARAAAATIFLTSVALLLVYFQVHYGRASLGAAYGPGLSSDVSLARLPRGMLALLLDRQFGLLAISPLYFLALPGLALLLRQRPGDGLRAILLAGSTVAVGAGFSMWWGGSCPPARFLVPALPALALALAPALGRFPDAAAALTGLGAGIVALAADVPSLLQNRADGESALLRLLAPALDLSGSLPSFVLPSPGASALALALLAALAWGCLRGGRALAAGIAACTVLSLSLRDRPFLDPRQAPLHLLSAYDGDNVVGLSGPLELDALRIPFDLPGAPWTLGPGDERLSRPLDLPPGRYRLGVRGRVLEALRTAHVLRLDLVSGDSLLLRAYLREGQPAPSQTLELPEGARRVRLACTDIQGAGRLDSAALQPLEIVPRSRR